MGGTGERLRPLAPALIMLAALGMGGTAHAMTKPAPAAIACSVTGPAKFVDQAGGEHAICTAVTKAVAEQRQSVRQVVVQLVSASTMAAHVTLSDGHTLPELRTAISDGTIGPVQVDRFAQDIVNQIASTLDHHR